jgi:putative spermidine/putrescine transport system permease protein
MSGRKRTLEAFSFELVMTVIAVIALIIIIAPSLVVLTVSFTSGFSLRFPPPGYSLRWYAELWNAWQLHFAAKNSLIVAVWATGLSVVLGVAAALAISRSPKLSARLLDSLFMSPLVLPALAFGLAALMLFSLVGLPVSPLTLVIGHTVVCVPYVVRNTIAALAQLEPTLLESSAVLGASRIYTFRRIVLPLIRPAYLTGLIYSFARSMTAISAVIFLTTPQTRIMTQQILNETDAGRYGNAFAYCVLLIGIVLVAIGVLYALVGSQTNAERGSSVLVTPAARP